MAGKNREKVQHAKATHSYWCPHCDMALVWDGKKCSGCGKKANQGLGRMTPTASRRAPITEEVFTDYYNENFGEG